MGVLDKGVSREGICFLKLVVTVALTEITSELSSSLFSVIPKEDNGGSVDESSLDERMNVADTDVTSRTERWSIGGGGMNESGNSRLSSNVIYNIMLLQQEC